jgi:hypothetical protein
MYFGFAALQIALTSHEAHLRGVSKGLIARKPSHLPGAIVPRESRGRRGSLGITAAAWRRAMTRRIPADAAASASALNCEARS